MISSMEKHSESKKRKREKEDQADKAQKKEKKHKKNREKRDKKEKKLERKKEKEMKKEMKKEKKKEKEKEKETEKEKEKEKKDKDKIEKQESKGREATDMGIDATASKKETSAKATASSVSAAATAVLASAAMADRAKGKQVSSETGVFGALELVGLDDSDSESSSDDEVAVTPTNGNKPSSSAALGAFGGLALPDSDDSSADSSSDAEAPPAKKRAIPSSSGGVAAPEAEEGSANLRGAALWSALESNAEEKQKQRAQKLSTGSGVAAGNDNSSLVATAKRANEVSTKTVKRKNNEVETSQPLSLEDQLERDIELTSDNPLHTTFLMANDLKKRGIKYTTGAFTDQESRIIDETIRNYITRHNKPNDLVQQWFSSHDGQRRKDKAELLPLWIEIATRLKTRPLMNVYLHLRRKFHPQNNLGTWSKEDDAKLKELYAKHKNQWTLIGQNLGRIADSCRDRYRNHLKDQDTSAVGTWSPEEDERLLDVLQDMAEKQGKKTVLEAELLWTTVAVNMKGTRRRHQCRHRYFTTLQPRLIRGEFWNTRAGAAISAQRSQEAAETQKRLAKRQRLAAEAQENGDDSGESDSESEIESDVDDDHEFNTAAAASSMTDRTLLVHRAKAYAQWDACKKIQAHGYKNHQEVDWALLYKEIRDDARANQESLFEKIIKARDDLRQQAKKQNRDQGSSEAVPSTATAAAAALAFATTAVLKEGEQLLSEIPTRTKLYHFIWKERNLERHAKEPFKEMIEHMIAHAGKKLESFDKWLLKQTARYERKKKGENKDRNMEVEVELHRRTTMDAHNYRLIGYLQSTALDHLLSQFPELHEATLKAKQERRIEPYEEYSLSAEDILKIVSAADAKPELDDSQVQVLERQREERDRAEDMIDIAMEKAGLPPLAARPSAWMRAKIMRSRRLNAEERLPKSREDVADSDVDSNSSDNENSSDDD